MALSHLSLESDKIEVYIDNRQNEDGLNDKEESTASEWNTIFTSSLDLSPLLYLKATTAELAVNQFSIDNLPLSTSRLEKITVDIQLPKGLSTANQYYNDLSLDTSNENPHKVATVDFSTSENEVLIDHLNTKLNTTLLLLQTCLRFIFDTEIFVANLPADAEITLKDANLISRYLDCILFSRHIYHKRLVAALGITDNIDAKITFPAKPKMSATTEKQILSESLIFRPVDQRPRPRTGNQIMNLGIFHNIDLKDAYTMEGGPRLVIDAEIPKFFRDIKANVRVTPNDPKSELTEYSKSNLHLLLVSNKQLIEHALKMRQIVSLLQNKRDGRRLSTLFNDRVIALNLDDSHAKLNVTLQPSLFLPADGSSITVTFPPKLSYVLGCKDGEVLTIGPITHATNSKAGLQRLTNTITQSYQSPNSALRVLPRLMYVCSDVVSTLTRNLWLKQTEFESCHIIYTHILDENNINTKFICKNSENLIFHKISSLRPLLNSFSVYILDQNFKKVVFPQKTYTHLGLVIKPTHNDN